MKDFPEMRPSLISQARVGFSCPESQRVQDDPGRFALNEFDELVRSVQETYKNNDLSVCKAYLDKAQALDPSSLEVQSWRARLAYKSSDWKTVGEVAAAYLEARPEDHTVARLYAQACNKLK